MTNSPLQSLVRPSLVACLFVFSVHGLCALSDACAQQPNAHAENVILVSIDGLRWQEVFGGADQRLISKDAGVADLKEIERRYLADSPQERRERLLPFLWSVIANEGQVLGNPEQNAVVSVTNNMHFSYPGYSEILCGFADPRIDSNDKVPNANRTVLEWLNRRPEYHGRVAAFTSWDVFPFIINAERSGIYVNAGWQVLDVFRDEQQQDAVNSLAEQLPHYWDGVRYDAFTYRGAEEYLHVKRPRVLYVAFGETDDWAHAGRYDLYLDAAEKTDAAVRRLWDTCQSLDQYRGKTSLLITTDHGRGDGRDSWKSHSTEIPGCDRIWIAALGPGIAPLNDRRDVTATQAQIAATVAALLGLDFQSSDSRIAPPLVLD